MLIVFSVLFLCHQQSSSITGELFFLADHDDQYSRTNLEGTAVSETHNPKDSGDLSITKPPRL
jgi:hypothetical protein